MLGSEIFKALRNVTSSKIGMDAPLFFDADLIDCIEKLVADVPKETWSAIHHNVSCRLLSLSTLDDMAMISNPPAFWRGAKDLAVVLHTSVCLVNKEHPVCDRLLDIIRAAVGQMAH